MKRHSRSFKSAIYNQYARIGKAISSPRRIELLDLLSQGSKTVESLALETDMSIANVSQHLQSLLEAQLVQFTKKGTYAYYQLSSPNVSDFLVNIERIAEERLPDVNQIRKEFFEKHDSLESVDINKLVEQIENEDVVLIDVRPREEYETGHIPGAVSLPIKELEELLSHLPKDKELVAYCRGKQCVYAVSAVEILRAKGYKVKRLEEGTREWNYLQYPLEGEFRLH